MSHPSILLVTGGDVLAPHSIGRTDLLLVHDRVVRVGPVDRRALDQLGEPWEEVDATGAWVIPGLIDPHEHLLGGSGEGGYAMQTPMLFASEIVRAGITTVVGVLGVDTTMKTMAGLLAHVKGLAEEGLTTRMWSGGYNVPPTTVMGSIRDDMLFVQEVIGAGEIAISDERGLDPSPRELARVVRDTHVGGLLSGKCGVTHFHVGEERAGLAPLRTIIEEHAVEPEWLYPTHVERNERLMGEALALAGRGATVDLDLAERDLARWYAWWRAHDGPMDRITLSSDADSNAPDVLLDQVRNLVVEHDVALEDVLPLVTANTARVLQLARKGRLEAGCDADVVVLDRADLAVREVIVLGRRMVVDGAVTVRERFLTGSSRRVTLVGDEALPEAELPGRVAEPAGAE